MREGAVLQHQAIGGSIQGGATYTAAPTGQVQPAVHTEIDTINELLSGLEAQAMQFNLRLSCVSDPESVNNAKESALAPAPNRVIDRLQTVSMRLRRVLAANNDLMDRLHV
jgi:hypothetical protein